MESIFPPFYNIYKVPGSLPLVLTSPDTEIAPQIKKTRPRLCCPFMHEDIIQSIQIFGTEQSFVISKIYLNFNPIQLLLPNWCTKFLTTQIKKTHPRLCCLFLHQDMVQLAQIFGLKQGSASFKMYQNFCPIQLLLPTNFGAPSSSLLAEIPPFTVGP